MGKYDMIPWYAPTSFRDIIRRSLAARTVLMLAAVVSLLVTEFRFDWVESVIGAYLVSTNHQRPESGTVWDQGHQTDLARKTLSQYSEKRISMQREARSATSMGQVIAGIDDDRGAMISASHFVELYQKLPPVLSHEIISPYTVLTHLSGNLWKRVFFERQVNQRLHIYLLDDHNQVMHRLVVEPVLIEHIQRGEVAIHSRLDQLADFAAQIYPAERFFTALNSLPEEVKKGILNSPGSLLRVLGRIVRVGVSSQSIHGSVDIGFEVESAQGVKVILTQGSVSHVQQLQWMLEERTQTIQPEQEGVLP